MFRWLTSPTWKKPDHIGKARGPLDTGDGNTGFETPSDSFAYKDYNITYIL